MAISRKQFQKIISLAFGVVALGAMGLPTLQLFTSVQPNQENTATAAVSREDQLQAEAKGYELVLQREPKNLTALEGLAQTHLKMNNFKAAQEPLEELVKLKPDQKHYQVLLDQVNQQVGDR